MKKFYIFVLITAMLLTVNVCYSHEIETNLVNKVIILDAGHGGIG